MPAPSDRRVLRYLRFWGADVNADVRDELEFHLEMRVTENIAAGMSAAEARADALRRFGDVDRVRNACETIGHQRENAMRRSEWIDASVQDLRFAIRQLARNPLLTLIATVTLALGIGANTAIYSVVKKVLLEPLPYDNPNRLVYVWERWRSEFDGNVAIGNFVALRDRQKTFVALAGWRPTSLALTGDGEPERLRGARVSASYFTVNHMAPAVGRYFLPDEDAPGSDRVVVLSYPLWQRRFAGDRSIVGREIELNGERRTVVGVTPAAYTLGADDDALWIPIAFTPEQIAKHDEHNMTVFGKLKPGVTIERAQADLSPIMEELARQFPNNTGQRTIHVTDARESLVGGYRTQLYVLLGAVGFVLLIACGNVANLLLARATTRQKEIAIRTALGAGRRRIVRQMLIESLMLAVIGGAAGLLVAYLGIRALIGSSPGGVPRLEQAGIDGGVLLFMLALTAISGVVFGLAPALRAARSDLQSTLREGGKGSATGASRDRLRNGLVVGEIAVALVLLISAGLLIRSARHLASVDPGFDPRGVLTARVSLPAVRYAEPPRVAATYDEILARLRVVPGVTMAALTSAMPLGPSNGSNGLLAEGRAVDPANFVDSDLRIVSPDFFQLMRIPLERGRTFTDRDVAESPRVIVINETLARVMWPDTNPLGKRVACCDGTPEKPNWKEVVGVVGDVHARGLGEAVRPEFYLPLAQAPAASWNWNQRSLNLVVRTGGDPASLANGVRHAVWSVDPTLPVYGLRTVDESVRVSTATTRFNMLVLALLGATGLVLAAIGIYGIIAYFVGQRTHEIGVRMALGASASQVRRMVLRQGLLLATAGLAVGLVAALGATRVLQGLLFGVTATDPATFTAVGALLALVAVVASYLPARRATRVSPTVALRG